MEQSYDEGKDTRTRILEAAYELFRDQGYNVVPLSAILERAGVSKGGFYHYFGSKEDLFFELVRNELDSLITTLEEIHPPLPSTRFWERLQALAHYLFIRHGDIRMLPTHFKDLPDSLKRRMHALILPQTHHILTLIAEPLIPSYGEERARRIAAMIVGAVRAPIFMFKSKNLPKDFDTYWKEFKEFLTRGVELP